MPLLLRRHRCCKCGLAPCGACCASDDGNCCYAIGVGASDEVVGLFYQVTVTSFGGIETFRVTQTDPSTLEVVSGNQCRFIIPCLVEIENDSSNYGHQQCQFNQNIEIPSGPNAGDGRWRNPNVSCSQCCSIGIAIFPDDTGRASGQCDVVDDIWSNSTTTGVYQLAVVRNVTPCNFGCVSC